MKLKGNMNSGRLYDILHINNKSQTERIELTFKVFLETEETRYYIGFLDLVRDRELSSSFFL